MGNPALVLASASPRRVELMRQLGVPFAQVASPISEPPPDGDDPQAHVLAAARAKAEAVAALLSDLRLPQAAQVGRGPFLVIGADTVVCCDRLLLGKPAGPEDAARMLRLLAGREHIVCTGIAVVGPGPCQLRQACETTRVWLAPLSAAAVARYVDSGEPFGKAGGYAIQGRGGRFIERVEGCYYNVVGLPLARLCALLESAGYDLDDSQANKP